MQVHYAKHAGLETIDPGPQQAPRSRSSTSTSAWSTTPSPPLRSKTQTGRAWHAPTHLLLSSGDENGVRPPWAAMSLTRARQGRVIKERLRNRPGEGEVCNTSP